MNETQAAQPFELIFKEALGETFYALPQSLQDLHSVVSQRFWSGRAEVTRGAGRLSRFVGWVIGFPKAGRDMPVEINMRRKGGEEEWERNFNGKRFRSYLSRGHRKNHGALVERFGPLIFHVDLSLKDGRLAFPVVAGECFGVALPSFLLPISETCEYVDAENRACFNATVSMPVIGKIVQYRGWLTAREPLEPNAKKLQPFS